MSWNPYYAILIAISTVITWLCGICVGKKQSKQNVSNQTNGEESQISDKPKNNTNQLKFLCVGASFIINLYKLHLIPLVSLLMKSKEFMLLIWKGMNIMEILIIMNLLVIRIVFLDQ